MVRLLLLAASMLAPEDVFAGKGDVKEAAELTQSERKRRCPPRKGDIKVSVTKIDSKWCACSVAHKIILSVLK